MITGVSQYGGGMNGVNFSAMRPRREEMFAKLDTNGDGSIDKAELTSFMQQLAGTGQTPPDAEEMFSRMDTDSNGKISKAEFEKDRRDEMFTKMDSNGDGSIDKAELTSFLQQLPGAKQAPPSPDEMFSQMDTDSDGSINPTELESFRPQGPGMGQAPPPPNAEEMFSRMDTDSDGKISKAEFDSFDPEIERPARPMTREQSGLGNEMTATTLSTLLNSLESNSKDNSTLLSSILQQYGMSVPSDTQSIINLLG